MSQSYESKLPPELGPNMGDVIQRTMEAAIEILDDLEPVELIVALVVLQLFIEVQKSLMEPDMLAAYQETLEMSSATTFPIIEEDDGEK
ncbi:MAG: hypothetical protein IKE76_01745 [Clostridia bacterium]|nr:hypothetical protein [Clostridia bacterium]